MNRLFTKPELFFIFARAFPDVDLIAIDDTRNYNGKDDFTALTQVRIKRGEYDRTCGLLTIDLVRDPDDLIDHLRKSWDGNCKNEMA